MKSYPTIDLLLSLTEEIGHLEESGRLLWELFLIADKGLPLDSNLRGRIVDHLSMRMND
jgi:hypothetical protein